MVKTAKPFVSRGDETACYWQLGNLWQMMATGPQTDNAFTMIDQVVAARPGGGPLTHAHFQDEGMYVLSGQCTFNAGGHQGLVGTPGSLVVIPGNTEHSFTVDKASTHILNFYLPAGFEQILLGVTHPASRREPPAQDKVVEGLPERWLADKLSDDYGTLSIRGQGFVDPPRDPKDLLTQPTPGATVFPFLTNARESPRFEALNGSWSILASGKQTGGTYCMFEVTYKRGIVFKPRIYSQDKAEWWYLLEGEMTFLLDDRIETVKKGDFVYIPAGFLYAARVDSDEAKFLNLHTRSGFEEVIEFFGNGAEAQKAGPVVDYRGLKIGNGAYGRLLEKIGLRYVYVPNPLKEQSS